MMEQILYLPNDFEVGLRHDLPVINVLTEDAKIIEDYKKYAGLDRYQAREEILIDLEKLFNCINSRFC